MKAGLYTMFYDDNDILGKNKTAISISPINEEGGSEEQAQALLKLQLKMATNSINHEYARMELEGENDYQRCEELLEYMEDCRHEYFGAREELGNYDSYALEEFEKDLMMQKKKTLSQYNA